MLTIEISEREEYDDINNEFIYTKGGTLQLEHSLVSISKWESKWKKPFLSVEEKTREETIDYIKCMTITQNVDPKIYRGIGNKVIEQVNEYIKDPMTATWFSNDNTKAKGDRKVITSERIYGWMVGFNIPFECQKWHLNRLLTLIRICESDNSDPKKMGKGDLLRNNTALNRARRASHHTKG